ncbi:hypothetical protein [Palleronia sp.]|uniref:hypothetical protein n=1 Tax=Palleronia sp. TaxID=1940284 RepID=UPI0035C78CD9
MADKTDEKKDAKRKDIWTSAQGKIDPKTLTKTEKGVVSATIKSEGGDERVVKGYNEKQAAVIEKAAASGEEIILRGVLLGSAQKGTQHISVKSEGPTMLNGVVSHIRRNAEGKQPFVNMFVLNEVTANGKDYKIGSIVQAFGADAESLADLNEGDRVSMPAREYSIKREKEGVTSWVDGFRATGPGEVIPAAAPAEKTAEKDADTEPSM